jgi:hypothetical protein
MPYEYALDELLMSPVALQFVSFCFKGEKLLLTGKAYTFWYYFHCHLQRRYKHQWQDEPFYSLQVQRLAYLHAAADDWERGEENPWVD